MGPLVKQGSDEVDKIVEASKKDPKAIKPVLNEALPKLEEVAKNIGAIECPEGTVFINEEIKAMFEEYHEKFDLINTGVGNGVYDDVPRIQEVAEEIAKTHFEALHGLLKENGFDDDKFMGDPPSLSRRPKRLTANS